MNTIKLNTIGERPVKKSGGSGGNYVYYSGTSNDFGEEITVASVIKYSTPENVSFMTNPFSDLPFDSIVGVGFDKSLKISHPFTGKLTTVGDFLAELGVEWTQITEEEFYKIPTQFTVRTSEDVVYEFVEGQSWRDWINSSANPGNFHIGEFDGKECMRVIDRGGNDFQLYVGSTSQLTHPDDTLVAGELYFVWA